MILSCWAMPRAKAVASESALLGSIFGSLLVSMGYSWAADNMDVPGFGEALYKLTQEYDETNKDTGAQLIRDLNLAGLTANGAGKLQFGYAWVQAARSFAEWFQGKFFTESTTAKVYGYDNLFSLNSEFISVDFPYTVTINKSSFSSFAYSVTVIKPVVFTQKITRSSYLPDGNYFYVSKLAGTGEIKVLQDTTEYVLSTLTVTQSMIDSGNNKLTISIDSKGGPFSAGSVVPISSVCSLTYDGVSSLTAEKPQEVHYPDVAEDDSQVYEITVDGVTATDIEGIIQGAVDRILAGTASIAGEVVQAQDVPAEPEAPPELDGLDLPALGAALTTRFPFSIPWDVARGIQMLAAPAEAPYWEVDFLAPLGYRVGGWEGSTMVVLDFSQFEVIGQVTRWMSTIGFCLMLASSTKRLIWVA